MYQDSKAQTGDTTENFIRNVWNSGWKKSNHIVDFKFSEFEPDLGALGYSYVHKPIEHLKFGFRFGMWYRKSKQDIPSNSARNHLTYSTDLLVNYSIWKFVNIEASTGYASYYYWPRNSNTTSTSSDFGSPFFTQRVGLNLIFDTHYILNIGAQFTFDELPNNWYTSLYWGIGYKF